MRAWHQEVAPSLLAWYRVHRRDLPWRRRPDAYRVWVSEVMLQQTQVETVIPYFNRFVDRFPDVERLAAAAPAEVLALWSGLGYYRRARLLHAAAQVVAREHRGRFPETLEGALSLPGVGRYTAGAVLSIAYNAPVPILDGNVERVLTRLLALRGDPRRAPLRTRLWTEAERLIPAGEAAAFNQALMELGALVCSPRAPRCGDCPVERHCRAAATGRAERFPEKAKARRTVAIRIGALLVRRRGRVLIQRFDASSASSGARSASGLPPSYLRGIWTLPMLELAPGEDAVAGLAALLLVHGRGELAAARYLGAARHAITFRRIRLEAWEGELRSSARPSGGRRRGVDWRWARPEELGSRYAVSSLVWKAMAMSEGNGGGAVPGTIRGR